MKRVVLASASHFVDGISFPLLVCHDEMRLCARWWWLWELELSLCWAMALVSSQQEDYIPPVSYLVDCGGEHNMTIEERQWMSDISSYRFLSSPSKPMLASVSTNFSSPLSPLLSTARFFNHSCSYSFPVSPGRYWVRLYFYPFPYQEFHPSAAVFSVTAGPYTLLDNIEVVDAIADGIGNLSYLFKEYSINVTDSSMVISFLPGQASNSYAFVNALEVVSMPSALITDATAPLGTNAPTPIGVPSMALETMYRVNVGGPLVTPSNDTAGLYRTWLPDHSFLFSFAGVANINTSVFSIEYGGTTSKIFAPPIVYSTALQTSPSEEANPQGINISWVFPVVAENRYVVRLHFCDLVNNIGGQRLFNVYLQNETAYTGLDVAMKVGGDTALHVDYSLKVGGDIRELWVQVGPPTSAADGIFNKPILNGIEIWKLNDPDGSLGDGLRAGGSKIRFAIIISALVGGMAAAGVLSFVVCLICRHRSKTMNQLTPAWLPRPMHSVSVASKVSTLSRRRGTGSHVSSAPSSLGRLFTFAEIRDATKSFDESLVIGEGGFGKVYLGELDDRTKVAVKRGNLRSGQGVTEFRTEIEMLSKLRHRHLVSLIGYSEEHREMILVYEYMAHGPLRSHLYGSDLPPLSWRQRLEICIGAARGLHHLHTGVDGSIIHRDVKTTNILLDEKFVAKVADFGLSKTASLERTHVTTAVKGSFGYSDPEYFRRQQLTVKSDVYSFGVVLVEVLCARRAINRALPMDQVNMAEWAMRWQRMGMLDQIIDPHLAGTINVMSLAKFGETAEKCLADEGINRPSIGEVLWNLESALQLHVTALANDEGINRPSIGEVLWNLESALQLHVTALANDVDEDSTNQISELPILLAVQGQWEECSGKPQHSWE